MYIVAKQSQKTTLFFKNQSTFWTHFGIQRLSLVHAVSRRAIHESNILALEYYEQQRRAKTMKDDNHDPYGRRKKIKKHKMGSNIFWRSIYFYFFIFPLFFTRYAVPQSQPYISTLMQVYFTHGWRSNLQRALKIVFEFQNVFKKYFD